jgi:hypothetical protein
LSLGAIRAVAAVLDVRADLIARWRAGDLDRLLNARHSLFHETVATGLARYRGWTFAPEVSFSVYGERGVVDLVGWNEEHRALLLIELKTDIADVNELIGTFDRKLRLGGSIARDRGWRPESVSGWIIVSPGRTNRTRIAAHRQVLRAACPSDGRTMGTWLRRPEGRLTALSIWRSVGSGHPITELVPVRRVRPRRARAA